jgi:hypothetical protein
MWVFFMAILKNLSGGVFGAGVTRRLLKAQETVARFGTEAAYLTRTL